MRWRAFEPERAMGASVQAEITGDGISELRSPRRTHCSHVR